MVRWQAPAAGGDNAMAVDSSAAAPAAASAAAAEGDAAKSSAAPPVKPKVVKTSITPELEVYLHLLVLLLLAERGPKEEVCAVVLRFFSACRTLILGGAFFYHFIILFPRLSLSLSLSLSRSLARSLALLKPHASKTKTEKRNQKNSPPRPQRPRQAGGARPRLLLGRDGGAGPRGYHNEQVTSYFFNFFRFLLLGSRGGKQKTSSSLPVHFPDLFFFCPLFIILNHLRRDSSMGAGT